MADIEGDGDLDLFVGGRVVPGRYPEAASSRMYRNNGRQYSPDLANNKVLEKAGLVSGAVWSDLDGDGLPELVLACEWGPVKVFSNRSGQLRETTRELGLEQFTGWWTGVTTGDLDGDGRLDIVAGNWGLNSDYVATKERPLVLLHGDFLERGMVDLVETEWDVMRNVSVPRHRLDVLGQVLPPLQERFATHRSYTDASVKDVLGPFQSRARSLDVNTLASTIFFNRGGRFEAVPLPREAQLAPAFGVNVADFDGDGNEDVFLSQNFFATSSETPRLDAGRGLLLRGNGKGGLQAVPGQESGLEIYGEQRGSATADYDADGRIDLVVAQNGAPTRLYRNVVAKPGLRVSLSGPPGNPGGVGAMVQLKFGSRIGPGREVHAGSGYWSQDSAVQIMGFRERPSHVRVRWPGGVESTTAVSQDAMQVTVTLEPSGR